MAEEMLKDKRNYMTNLEEIVRALKGKKIEKMRGFKVDSEGIYLHIAGGWIYEQYHAQDCCEQVYVAQVDGDPLKHEGALVVDIQEKIVEFDEASESGTATFYTLTTSKGYLDWRWVGESNGYYSESVDHRYGADKRVALTAQILTLKLERATGDLARKEEAYELL